MDKVYKKVPVRLKSVDEAKRRIRMIISTKQVDRDGDVVVPKGAQVQAYLQNPIVLFGHMHIFPVANATAIEVRENEIEAEVEFFTEDESPLAERMWKLYSRGKMKAASIGFMPTADGISEDKIMEGQTGRTFNKWELLEFSLVSVPSNRQALTIEREAALVKGLSALMPEDCKDPEKGLVDIFDIGGGSDKSKKRLVISGVKSPDDADTVIAEVSLPLVTKLLKEQGIEVQFEEDDSVLDCVSKDAKSGRVVSKRNMDRLKAARQSLDEVITEEEQRRQDNQDEPVEASALAALTRQAEECRNLVTA